MVYFDVLLISVISRISFDSSIYVIDLHDYYSATNVAGLSIMPSALTLYVIIYGEYLGLLNRFSDPTFAFPIRRHFVHVQIRLI